MQTVNHTMFGIGEVIAKEVKENDIFLTVRFADGNQTRVAIGSFEAGFVVAEGDLKEEIEKLIENKKAIKEKKRADFIAATTVNTATAAPVARHRGPSKTAVNGPIASAFEAYLINEGYSTQTPSGHPSTVYSYINAIEKHVLDDEHITWDTLKANIGSIVKKYDVGGLKESIGAISNSTVIDALKCFARFVVNP